jgi:hypothetical protein
MVEVPDDRNRRNLGVIQMMRKVIAFNLAAVLALGASPIVLAQQGVISGRADDEARKPYSDYTVQLMDLQTNQIAATAPIDGQGRFAFDSVSTDKRYLVQLFNAKDSKVVCTEGPYALVSPMLSKTDVNIDCGKPPTALWLLAAAAGVAASVAVTSQSTYR